MWVRHPQDPLDAVVRLKALPLRQWVQIGAREMWKYNLYKAEVKYRIF